MTLPLLWIANKRTNAQIHNRTNEQTSKRDRVNDRMNTRSNDQTMKRTHEQTSKRANDQTMKRTHEKTSKRANEQTMKRANKQTNKRERTTDRTIARANEGIINATSRDIVDQVVEFIGEYTGRKLVLDLLNVGKYRSIDKRIHVTDVYDRLRKTLIKAEKCKSQKKPYLLQVVHRNHYIGIRVEHKGTKCKVYVLDPAEKMGIYPPLPTETVDMIREIFGVQKTYRASACQLDDTDTFCQTWSLVLLSNPSFKVSDPRQYILDLFKQIVGSKIFEEWLSGRKGVSIEDMRKLLKWQTGRLSQAVDLQRKRQRR